MQVNIQKWGNSLGIRIPKAFAKKLGLHEGSKADIELEQDHLCIYPKTYQLSELLDQVTPENLHHIEIDDLPQGREEW